MATLATLTAQMDAAREEVRPIYDALTRDLREKIEGELRASVEADIKRIAAEVVKELEPRVQKHWDHFGNLIVELHLKPKGAK